MKNSTFFYDFYIKIYPFLIYQFIYFGNGGSPKVNFSIQIFLYLSNERLFTYFQFHFLNFDEDPYIIILL